MQIDFDFIDHRLVAVASDAQSRSLALQPMPVAAFHERFRSLVDELGASIDFDGSPNEIPDPVPFADNTAPGAYDADAVQRYWRALLQVDRVFKQFRTAFLGKVSPVHLFWGSFDVAVTRFSGRAAPPHPGGIPALPDAVTRDAYSHEVSSAGFGPAAAASGSPPSTPMPTPHPKASASNR